MAKDEVKLWEYEGAYLKMIVTHEGSHPKWEKDSAGNPGFRTRDTFKAKCVIIDMREVQTV